MNFQINYDSLKKLSQIKFHRIILLLCVVFVILIIISFKVTVYKKLECYGIYNNGLLIVKVSSEQSQIIKDNHDLTFNGDKLTYKVNSFGEYELIENGIYEQINLTIDNVLYDNEVGIVTIHYGKQKLIKYIFELFK